MLFCWPIHSPRPSLYTHLVALYQRQLISSFAPVIITVADRGLYHLNVNLCCFGALSEMTHAVAPLGRTVLSGNVPGSYSGSLYCLKKHKKPCKSFYKTLVWPVIYTLYFPVHGPLSIDVFVSLLKGRLCSSLLHKLVTSPQLFSHRGFQCSLELLGCIGWAWVWLSQEDIYFKTP